MIVTLKLAKRYSRARQAPQERGSFGRGYWRIIKTTLSYHSASSRDLLLALKRSYGQTFRRRSASHLDKIFSNPHRIFDETMVMICLLLKKNVGCIVDHDSCVIFFCFICNRARQNSVRVTLESDLSRLEKHS